MRTVSLAAFVLAFPVCAIGTLSAATIVVKPDTAIATVNAGHAAASAGDTILVKSGTYVETLLVTKANLTIKAQGKVVFDASDASGSPGGSGFLVNASGVTIEGFTIRNARTVLTDFGDGIRVGPTGNDVTIRKCTILQSLVGGIALAGSTGAVIENCVIDGAADGITMSGTTDVTVRKCTVKRAANSGMTLNGTTNVLVDKSTFRFAEDNGGIDANGSTNNDGLTVRSCVFRSNDGFSIAFKGSTLLVEKSKFEKSAKSTVVVFTSSDVTVKGCSFRDLADGGAGVEFSNVTTGSIENCSFRDVAGSAVTAHGGTSIVVRDCSMKDGGAEREPGIFVDDITTFTLEKLSISGFSDGIVLLASTFGEVLGCTITSCRQDGIDVRDAGTSDIVIEDCKVGSCLAEGIDNSGAPVQVNDCVVTKNRIDIANEGWLGMSNVTFVTGGFGTTPQID